MIRCGKLQRINDLLEPFASTVNDLEGDSYVTQSKVLPAIIDLIESLPASLSSTSRRDIIETVRRKLRKEFESRFAFMLEPSHDRFQPVYMLATFFDPE